MTAVCLAFAVWLLLVAGVVLSPALARAIGAAVLILFVAAAVLTPARSADIWAYKDSITITGQIVNGDDEVFSNAVTPETKIIYLTSPGGGFVPSLRIGRIVKQKGLET